MFGENTHEFKIRRVQENAKRQSLNLPPYAGMLEFHSIIHYGIQNINVFHIKQHPIAHMNFNKRKSFLLVLSGYTLWIILDTFFWIYFEPAKVILILEYNGSILICGLIVCALLVRSQWSIIAISSSRNLISILAISLTAVFFSVCLALIDNLMYNFWTTWKFHLQVNNVISGSFNCLVLSAALTGSFYVAYYRSLSMQQKEQLARAKALADEARLLMLRYQINPHFLFNALNAIQSMIEKDKVRAKEMIADLSDFFRYTLSKNNQMLVPLGDEIEAVRKYLAIQKDRFAGRLEIDYEIEGDALKVMLPFFIIHPLVENAVKYGFSSETDILRLFIGATRNEQTLSILVKNTGRLVPAERRAGGESTGTRTGIDNIKKRLALFYPDCSAFELLEKDRCVHALITITHPSMSA